MSFGITELLIVLIIVVLLFGTKKLKNLGGDLGSAIKNFRGAMSEADESESAVEPSSLQHKEPGRTLEGEVIPEKDKEKESV